MAKNIKNAQRASPPLPLLTYYILFVLVGQELHGFDILQRVRENLEGNNNTKGRSKIATATLYRTINTMLEDGLIELVEKPSEELTDQRLKKFYKLTPHGETALILDTERQEALVNAVKKQRKIGNLSLPDLHIPPPLTDQTSL